MATRFPKKPLLLVVFLAGFCLGIGPEPPGNDEGRGGMTEKNDMGSKNLVGDTGWVVSGNGTKMWSAAAIESIHDILDVNNVDRLKRLLENGGTEELGGACALDALEFARAWESGKPWAMAMSDSSGRYSSQFFLGDGLWLGSMTLCETLEPLRVEDRHQQQPETPPPVVTSVEHSTSVREKAPFPVSFVSAQMHMNLPEEFQPTKRVVTLGLCVPRSCASNAKDAKLLTRYLSGANETDSPVDVMKSTGGSLTLLSIRKVPGDYDPLMDNTLIALMVTSAILLLAVTAGTILDVLDRRSKIPETIRERVEKKMEWLSCERGHKHICIEKTGSGECNGNHLSYVQGAPPVGPMAEEEMVDSEKKLKASFGSTIKGILLCFSLRYNVVKLFEKSPPADHSVGPSLGCLHGLRVFSLFWVITGHACLIAVSFGDNKSFRGFVEKDFLFQSVSNGAFSVDTFFFISGLLVSYLYFKAMERASVFGLTNNFRSTVVKFVAILTYRFIRLTPTYLFAIGLAEVSARWLADKSAFPPPVFDQDTCHHYWWRNVLYISTFYPAKEMCMVWSWYLADDTQFYTLGAVLLLISSRYFRTAVTSGLVLLVSSWFTTGVITYIARHSPSIEEPFSLFDELYDKPWTRLGPYMVGMVVGWMLTKDMVYRKIHKVVSALMWALSLGLTFALVYGLYGRKIGPLESAAHTALSHTTWGLAIGWIVVSCATGRGGPVNFILSNRCFVPLSRLSFCAYLIHPFIMFAVYMHSDSPIHLTRDTMVMTIGGFIGTSYLLAFVISMAIEAPSIRLLEFIHPIKKKLRGEEQGSRDTSSTLSSTRR